MGSRISREDAESAPQPAPSPPSQVPSERQREREWTARLRGHDYAVDVDASWKGNRVVVRIDDEIAHDKVLQGERETITLPGGRTLTLRLSPLGALKRATIQDGAVDLVIMT